MTITCVNDNPVAVDDTGSTNRNVSVTVAVLFNDTDSDYLPLAVTGVTAVSGGTASISGTGVLFTPNA